MNNKNVHIYINNALLKSFTTFKGMLKSKTFNKLVLGDNVRIHDGDNGFLYCYNGMLARHCMAFCRINDTNF